MKTITLYPRRFVRWCVLPTLALIFTSGLAFAQPRKLTAGNRKAQAASVVWQHNGSAPQYGITVVDSVGAAVPFSTSINNPFPVPAGTPNSTQIGAIIGGLEANDSYVVAVTDLGNGKSLTVAIPPFNNGANGGGGNGGGNGGAAGGGGTLVNTGNLNNQDPLAQRMAAAAEFLTAQGEYLKAQGEYVNQLAEARKKIAEAVDMELDNWKKYVVTYFERREENLRGRMRITDLYDMKKDQTLRLRDTAMRRQYETLKKHPKLTRNAISSGRALNFMLDRFAGTPIGYGIPLEEAFKTSGATNRWNLTPEMHHELRVRARSAGGGYSEFRLDQPTAIAFDWPAALQQEPFTNSIEQISQLQEQAKTSRTTASQIQLVDRLLNSFHELTREFYTEYPDGTWGAYRDEDILSLRRAEDFLSQKTKELASYRENPSAITRPARHFSPERHGKDAGTLISWMSRNGLTFAKPLPGQDSAYHSVFSMMLELYVLYGEPAASIPKTDLPIKPPANKDGDKDEENDDDNGAIKKVRDALDTALDGVKA